MLDVACPLLLLPPNTSFPEGRWDGAGGAPVGLCALVVAVDIGAEVVALGTGPMECLPGFPSRRLPVPMKALNFGSSASAAAVAGKRSRRNKDFN